MRLSLFISFFFITFGAVFSQSLKKLHTISFTSKVTGISVDRLGNFYTYTDCFIQKFDTEGKPIKQHKLEPCSSITSIEAWGLARIFAYQKENQQFIILNPELDQLDIKVVEPSAALAPTLACPTPDMNSYWILDIDNTLRKFDAPTGTVTIETEALKGVAKKIIHLREYQNEIFALDAERGIFVLNKMGTLISTINATNINYFSFAGEDLYYLKGNQVHFYNIFNQDHYTVEVPSNYSFVVATDERLILINNNIAEVFAYQPKQ